MKAKILAVALVFAGLFEAVQGIDQAANFSMLLEVAWMHRSVPNQDHQMTPAARGNVSRSCST